MMSICFWIAGIPVVVNNVKKHYHNLANIILFTCYAYIYILHLHIYNVAVIPIQSAKEDPTQFGQINTMENNRWAYKALYTYD